MNDLMTKSLTSYVNLKKAAMMKDLEAGPDPQVEMAAGGGADGQLGPFLEEAEQVKAEMGSIREILGKLQQANEETKSLHSPEAIKSLRGRIRADVMAVLKKARAIKTRLEEMDRANEATRRLSGCREGTPVYRTRLAVTAGLRRKLKELMCEFQGLRQRMMSEHKEAVGRRYFTLTGEYPAEAVVENIISKGAEEELLSRAIHEHGKGKVLEVVMEIQDRYDAAREVESSLLELHQVFLDMALMVEAQGEQLDDIEHHVMNAAHYVKDGTKDLRAAKEYQRKSRKWLIIGLVLLLLLILIIVLPIATSFSSS